MLTLYRKNDCPACDEVEAQLRELTLAHKVVRLEAPAGSAPPIPPGAEPPVVWDDGQIYTGSEMIRAHLEQLAKIKDRWQQLGADACYCDEDGEVL